MLNKVVCKSINAQKDGSFCITFNFCNKKGHTTLYTEDIHEFEVGVEYNLTAAKV